MEEYCVCCGRHIKKEELVNAKYNGLGYFCTNKCAEKEEVGFIDFYFFESEIVSLGGENEHNN